jgi:poly-gamma-glutamate capsule biosynthesis protein CapA/YwtB (metallophosphatase superfamily)
MKPSMRLIAVAILFLIGSLLACLPGEPVHPTFTFAFVGDVMLGRGVAQSLNGHWEDAFKEVEPWLATADLAFANLESPLTTAPRVSNGYDVRAKPASVTALRTAGFDVVSLANNHALDAGQPGLAETIATLDSAGITGLVEETTDGRTGSRLNAAQEGQQPQYTSGVKPLSGPLSASGGPEPAKALTPIRNSVLAQVQYKLLAFDDSTIPLDIKAAAKSVALASQQADLVIVSVHWGGEYQAEPSPRQQSIARALAEAGADLIIGHGPHVLQRIERIGETLVAYSLGNFLFDQPYPADCRWGVILRVTYSVQGSHCVEVEPIPTVVERGRVRPANSQEATAILTRLAWERRASAFTH